MKISFPWCTSPNEDENIVDEDNNNQQQQSRRKNSKARIWFDSVRNFLMNNDKSKIPRVEISEPVPVSKEIADQITVKVVDDNVVERNEETKINNDSEDLNKKEKNKENIENTATELSSQLKEKDEKVDSETNLDDNLIEKTFDNSKMDKVTPNKNNIQQKIVNSKCLSIPEDLLSCSWFWGDISRKDAEYLLRGKEEGTFLVRLSSDKRFSYSLSFRSNGKTLHSRIECSNGLFYFYSDDTNPREDADGASSLVELISDAVNQNNDDNVFFYSRGLKKSGVSLHTITLVKPLSRFQYCIDQNDDNSKCLQYLCKFIIHHSANAQEMVQKFIINDNGNDGGDNNHSKTLKTFLEDPLLFPLDYKKSRK